MAARQDGLSERVAYRISLVFQLVPDVARQALAQQGFSARREDRETVNFSGCAQVGAALGLFCRRPELLLPLNHGLDAVVHILDKLDLGQAEASLVRDVVDVVGGLGVLAVDATNLDLEAVSDGFELRFPLSKVR